MVLRILKNVMINTKKPHERKQDTLRVKNFSLKGEREKFSLDSWFQRSDAVLKL